MESTFNVVLAEVLRGLLGMQLKTRRQIAMLAGIQPSNLTALSRGEKAVGAVALRRLYDQIGILEDATIVSNRVLDWRVGGDLQPLEAVLKFAGASAERPFELIVVQVEGGRVLIPGEVDNGFLFCIRSARHRIRLRRFVGIDEFAMAKPLVPQNVANVVAWRGESLSVTLPPRQHKDWMEAKPITLKEFDRVLDRNKVSESVGSEQLTQVISRLGWTTAQAAAFLAAYEAKVQVHSMLEHSRGVKDEPK